MWTFETRQLTDDAGHGTGLYYRYAIPPEGPSPALCEHSTSGKSGHATVREAECDIAKAAETAIAGETWFPYAEALAHRRTPIKKK